VGLRLHPPLWDLRGTYGGELIYFERSAPGGIWNQRAALSLEARPTRRSTLAGAAQFQQIVDPAGLAQVGVFRTGRQGALIIVGRGRLEWAAERTEVAAGTFNERTVLFDDGSGGAMHAPGVEALWRYGRTLQLGAAYGFGMFQSFEPAPGTDENAFSHAVRARATWRATRHISLNSWVGPALWLPGTGSKAVVPEAFVEMLIATRALDLRVNAGHSLGLGATAHPGLVDALEFGLERRFTRRYFVRGAGGLWRSGAIPSGSDALTGYAVTSEMGMRFHDGLRLSLAAGNYGRLEDERFQRTTVALRVGWELPMRR